MQLRLVRPITRSQNKSKGGSRAGSSRFRWEVLGMHVQNAGGRNKRRGPAISGNLSENWGARGILGLLLRLLKHRRQRQRR